MATRGGVAAVLVVLALAMAAASAAVTPWKMTPQPPKQSTPGDPKKLPPGAKYITVTPSRFHNRNYEITCRTDWGASCLIKCPARCPNKCLAYCAYCLTFCLCDFIPGTSCGDPRFTGGDGNTFYFHGKKDESFCLVSDPALHVNARFVGNHNAESGRDFTWVQALGVTFAGNNNNHQHRLYIGARKAVEWDEDEDHVAIVLDGEPVEVEAAKNARWTSAAVPGFSVTRTDVANAVVVDLNGVFAITANAVPITDEDSRVHSYGKTRNDTLVHLDVGYKFHGLTKDVDGVLGQTYRPDYVTKVDVTANMPVMGGADKYSSSGLFATDCAVSRFARAPVVTAFAS
ncbi:hypothetical protein PR202_ga24388 [Eleusine coracana subsp. coracana]|uniref:Uncharacterized protein n=1 Tax=Eleusine coracana subsp. coracana TaxID=191504 RepID=A0AAV5D8R1_ELECO|nr:hypothetical protein QOZ80_9AG0679370 [Eleusine coracana subsp. coracana]GJN06637.1 hypothetical protein PR202_ga24388 [Eleusine coracana subsp. coracana]